MDYGDSRPDTGLAGTAGVGERDRERDIVTERDRDADVADRNVAEVRLPGQEGGDREAREPEAGRRDPGASERGGERFAGGVTARGTEGAATGADRARTGRVRLRRYVVTERIIATPAAGVSEDEGTRERDPDAGRRA
jgi:hypothetical protein